jgi:hypothetical protein
MRRPLISEADDLTFSDYFKFNVDVDEVLPYFGFTFEARLCTLPRTTRPLDRLSNLQSRLEEALPFLSLTNQAARREFMIAPVLMDLVHYTRSRIRVEYPLVVNQQLHGTLDYFMHVANSLVVIEAKNADMTKGFLQLAVELVALDQWFEVDVPLLYGAVSIGDLWQFGILDRKAKRVTKDLNLYRVPADLEPLMRILVGILTNGS